MDFSPLFAKLLTFITLMLAGYAGARKKILCPGFAKSLSWLVMDVFLSCTILNSVTSGSLDISGAQLVKVILLLSLVMLISYAFGALVARVFFRGRENTPVFELLISVMNNIFIGLPIAEALYGATAVLYCALSCIPYNLLLYSYGVWRLRSGKALGGGAAFKIKDVFTVPLFATLAALLIFIFDIQLPYILRELISTTASATMPASMIVIGATLGGVKIADGFKERYVYLIGLMRLVIVPAAVWFIVGLLSTDAMLVATCTIIAACPSAVVVSILALQNDYDAAFSSNAVLVTTALSMVSLPVWVYILG